MSRVVFTPVQRGDTAPKGRVVFTPLPPEELKSIKDIRVQKAPEDTSAESRPRKRSRAARRRFDAMIADNRNTISVMVVFAATTAVALLLYVLIRPE
jgi:hypothetical protein